MQLTKALTLGILLALSCGSIVAQAQDAPVPVIPETLPQAVRSELALVRAPLLARVDDHNQKVDAFNSACGHIQPTDSALIASCTQRFQAMSAEGAALDEDKRRFAAQLDAAITADAPCASLETQLDRDKDALRRQQKTNEAGVAEIEAWTNENEDALKEGAIDGIKAAAGLGASALEKRERNARAFAGSITKYKNQMKNEGIPIEALMDKIETAERGYLNANIDVAAGKLLTVAGTSADIYANFRTQAGIVAGETAAADQTMKAALSDPTFQKFVESDPTEMDLLRSMLDVASSASDFAKFSPEYTVASLVVDGGYDYKKWSESKARILRQYDLTDTELKAVASLQGQIERTMQKLKACRAE